MAESKRQLVRGLTLTHSTSIIICASIGTGILMKTSIMAQAVGTPLLVIAAWIIAGLITLTGALTVAELGAMLPKAGGPYVFVRTAYGNIPAFFFSWMQFIMGPAGLAGLSVAFAAYFNMIFQINKIWVEKSFMFAGSEIHWQFSGIQVIAVCILIGTTILNLYKVSFSGLVQTILTIIKLCGLLTIIVGVFFFSKNATWDNFTTSQGTLQWCGIKPFGAAVVAAFYAYLGWMALMLVAGEVKNPGRNIPIATIMGTLVVIITFCAINIAYLYALPLHDIATSNSALYPTADPVAGKVIKSFLSKGFSVIMVLFLIQIFGTIHSTVLVGPRIIYAIARDNLFFTSFGSVNKARVPAFSIIINSILACILALSGSYDILTTYYVFIMQIMFIIVISSVFVLRRKMPDATRPYKTLGYPVIPIIFVTVISLMIINTILTNPFESFMGILLILTGLPLYLYFRYKKKHENSVGINESNL